MKWLNKLLETVHYDKIYGDFNIEINELKIDSKKCVEKDVFICLSGENYDGENYVNYAIKNGVNVVISSHYLYLSSIVNIVVKDTRIAFCELCAAYYDHPEKDLHFIGVVGTNGKSTTAYLVHKLLKANSIVSGLIGTIYYEYQDTRCDSSLTTPDPDELFMLLRKMLDSGVTHVVMEVSAHSIYYKKTSTINFEVKIYTNFTQDHLDFFKNMKSYRDCKKSFFMESNDCLNIINADDNLGIELINTVRGNIISYGINNPSDVFSIEPIFDENNMKYILNIDDEIVLIKTKLFGMFNVYNEMAAIICACHYHVPYSLIQEALLDIAPPDGRFNRIYVNKVNCIIDYAHTPDGLYNLLKEAKNITHNRIITIFGCGGNRDVTKRPLMGKIASEMSNIVIITTDNPRTEDRTSIITDILLGIKNKSRIFVEPDRKKAIKLAFDIANENDLVLIAGKGSEKYIYENNERIPFNDLNEVKKIAK